MAHKQIRGFILGEFINKIIEEQENGYTFNVHEVYKIGREYIADLRIVQKVEEPVEEPVEEVVEAVAEEVINETEVITEGTVPDWDKIEQFLSDNDKVGLEEYARLFGVELSRRKTVHNMYADFKQAIGA